MMACDRCRGRCDKRYAWNDLAADYNCKGAEPCREKNDCGCDKQ